MKDAGCRSERMRGRNAYKGVATHRALQMFVTYRLYGICKKRLALPARRLHSMISVMASIWKTHHQENENEICMDRIEHVDGLVHGKRG